ncbi:MAG: ABC transporter permease [Bacteroidales bacterium]|nr:ABC transporter permease [Bacteroidales bacterium]
MKHKPTIFNQAFTIVKDLWLVFLVELKLIFSDFGVMLIFFVAGIFYPIVYSFIYSTEALSEIPIAVVDLSASSESREFIREMDATKEMQVKYKCVSMEEAQELFYRQKVRGIVYFPNDYQDKLAQMEQAHISLYCDMSSFLYYKSILMAANNVYLNQLHKIEIQRYGQLGIVGEQAAQLVQATPYNEVFLYNPAGGIGSFLLPAVLILIIHQTLIFGMGMLAGAEREEKHPFRFIPKRILSKSIQRVMLGKAAAYFLIYFVISAYILGLVPKFFDFPQIGNIWDIYLLLIPFLLATIFFGITLSTFVKNRETGMVTMLFFSVILLFLSGVSWPWANIPNFWKHVAYIFPSTPAIHGYIHINTMGAELSDVHQSFTILWIQTGFYFMTALLSIIVTKYRMEEYKIHNTIVDKLSNKIEQSKEKKEQIIDEIFSSESNN